jgi:hypothetical protein
VGLSGLGFRVWVCGLGYHWHLSGKDFGVELHRLHLLPRDFMAKQFLPQALPFDRPLRPKHVSCAFCAAGQAAVEKRGD